MTNVTSKPYWLVKTEEFTLIYNIAYSMNPFFTDYELWEYGIECNLYNKKEELVSSAHVSHISPCKDTVEKMIYVLVKHQVFPVHLTDIVCEFTERIEDFDNINIEEAIA